MILALLYKKLTKKYYIGSEHSVIFKVKEFICGG